MRLHSVMTWGIFFSRQDMQTHLCDYLDICLAPQQEICTLSAQQPASLERNTSKDKMWSILVQLGSSSCCSSVHLKAVSPRVCWHLSTPLLAVFVIITPAAVFIHTQLTDFFCCFSKSYIIQYPSPSHSLESTWSFSHVALFAYKPLP